MSMSDREDSRSTAHEKGAESIRRKRYTDQVLDATRVRAILDAELDYYSKCAIEYATDDTLVPVTAELLDRALAGATRVLDIGCGRGDTLRRNASAFSWGVGIDDDMSRINLAQRALLAERIGNIALVRAAARALPFAADSFDIVFSERGPLAYCDETLAEALRVLRPGGAIFIETIGERNHIEVRRIFESSNPSTDASHLANLALEESRLRRFDVDIRTLASRVQTLRFRDVYDWLTYQCSVWRYVGFAPPREMHLYDRFAAENSDRDGRIAITYHTLWLAGTKRHPPR
jgi:ubiquinone/menaquinone biosynthesis C-methylase UbiE